ncbi:hypothetical protein Hanom_Chr07g00618161 [Helianthus anomalus]
MWMWHYLINWLWVKRLKIWFADGLMVKKKEAHSMSPSVMVAMGFGLSAKEPMFVQDSEF